KCEVIGAEVQPVFRDHDIGTGGNEPPLLRLVNEGVPEYEHRGATIALLVLLALDLDERLPLRGHRVRVIGRDRLPGQDDRTAVHVGRDEVSGRGVGGQHPVPDPLRGRVLGLIQPFLRVPRPLGIVPRRLHLRRTTHWFGPPVSVAISPVFSKATRVTCTSNVSGEPETVTASSRMSCEMVSVWTVNTFPGTRSSSVTGACGWREAFGGTTSSSRRVADSRAYCCVARWMLDAPNMSSSETMVWRRSPARSTTAFCAQFCPWTRTSLNVCVPSLRRSSSTRKSHSYSSAMGSRGNTPSTGRPAMTVQCRPTFTSSSMNWCSIRESAIADTVNVSSATPGSTSGAARMPWS